MAGLPFDSYAKYSIKRASLNSMDFKYHSPTLKKKINENFVKKMREGERILVLAYQLLSEMQLTAILCSHAFL